VTNRHCRQNTGAEQFGEKNIHLWDWRNGTEGRLIKFTTKTKTAPGLFSLTATLFYT